MYETSTRFIESNAFLCVYLPFELRERALRHTADANTETFKGKRSIPSEIRFASERSGVPVRNDDVVLAAAETVYVIYVRTGAQVNTEYAGSGNVFRYGRRARAAHSRRYDVQTSLAAEP